MQEKKFNNALEKAQNLSSDTQKAKGHLQDSGWEVDEEILTLQKHEADKANERLALAERKEIKKQEEKNEALKIKAERERQKALLRY